MSKFKGTTLIAFSFKRFNGKEIERGIVAGADSRLSSSKQILDMAHKLLPISNNIRILLSVNGKDCEGMYADLRNQLSNRVQNVPLTVSDVADLVITHLNHNISKNSENTNIGSLIVSWDENEVTSLPSSMTTSSYHHHYGELKEAKNEIKKLYTYEKDLEPILEIIETKPKGRLDRPLHVARYMLNPYCYYQDRELPKDVVCMKAAMTCIEMFFPNYYDLQDLVANAELVQY
ncbi:hypothetical protein OROMI_033898 [Orobanche minor]